MERLISQQCGIGLFKLTTTTRIHNSNLSDNIDKQQHLSSHITGLVNSTEAKKAF